MIKNKKYVKVPEKPRFDYAKYVGRKFFNSLKILQPPIDPFKIIDSMNNCKYVLDNLEGEEGYTLKAIHKNKYQICIDNFKYKPRMKFTAAHEIGHIILNHFIDFDFYSLEEHEEFILDKEADVFAGEILMPKTMIVNSGITKLESLMSYFAVSEEAMKVRLSFLGLGYILDCHEIPKPNDKVIILENYKESIELLHNQMFKGDTKLNKQDFIDSGYTTGHELRLVDCPKCGFNKFHPDAIYCVICGMKLYNACTNEKCGDVNEGYARFCSMCGSPTYLYRHNFLEDHLGKYYSDYDNQYADYEEF